MSRHRLQGDAGELLAGLQPQVSDEELLRRIDPSAPLRIERGDLWKKRAEGWKVVVTTNIGWDPVTFANNMGAGVALQAALRWPELPEWYGRFCRGSSPNTPVVERSDLGLVFFPVKPLLDPADPERSWAQPASLERIELSAHQLAATITGNVALAFPGCGNGGLDRADVLPILQRWLRPAGRFLIVDRDA